MSSRRWRLSVYLLVALISVPLFNKSRALPEKWSPAFLRFTTGSVLVKVKGGEVNGGVYRIFDGETGPDVKKMTLSGVEYNLKSNTSVNRQLKDGAVLEVSGETLRITTERMTAVELIMLGIPLDPSSMSTADWGSLPGIGPVLASEIIEYRQKNGAISSLEELGTLSGLGPGKLKRIRPFFYK